MRNFGTLRNSNPKKLRCRSEHRGVVVTAPASYSHFNLQGSYPERFPVVSTEDWNKGKGKFTVLNTYHVTKTYPGLIMYVTKAYYVLN